MRQQQGGGSSSAEARVVPHLGAAVGKQGKPRADSPDYARSYDAGIVRSMEGMRWISVTFPGGGGQFKISETTPLYKLFDLACRLISLMCCQPFGF